MSATPYGCANCKHTRRRRHPQSNPAPDLVPERLERVNKEIKRRIDVVCGFPNPAALLRLAGAVLVEQPDESEAGDRRYFSDASMAEPKTMNNLGKPPAGMPEMTAT